MRYGTGTGRASGSMLLVVGALAAAGQLGASASDTAPVTSSLERARPANGGASPSSDTMIFTLSGTAIANNITAFADSTGRLVISSPEGILEPDGKDPECVQDSPTQVSCMPGYIGAIRGDLGAGSDSFSASSTLPVLIGISLVSEERPLAGGPGRDRIVGGLGGDLIDGGAGPDTLLGFGGGDLLRGALGRDGIGGGGGSDNLLGGAGPDKLDGGAARDLCNGGAGSDLAKSCNVTKKIP